MIVLIIGRARAGKTTAAKFLEHFSDWKSASTSEIVYDVVALATNTSVEELKKIPKESIRPTLIDTADYLCDIYPSILSEGLIKKGYKIIDGIRRTKEMDSLSGKNYGLFVIYLKRNESIDDNFNIGEDYADVIVDNNGTLGELKEKIKEIYEEIKY